MPGFIPKCFIALQKKKKSMLVLLDHDYNKAKEIICKVQENESTYFKLYIQRKECGKEVTKSSTTHLNVSGTFLKKWLWMRKMMEWMKNEEHCGLIPPWGTWLHTTSFVVAAPRQGTRGSEQWMRPYSPYSSLTNPNHFQSHAAEVQDCLCGLRSEAIT